MMRLATASLLLLHHLVTVNALPMGKVAKAKGKEAVLALPAPSLSHQSTSPRPLAIAGSSSGNDHVEGVREKARKGGIKMRATKKHQRPVRLEQEQAAPEPSAPQAGNGVSNEPPAAAATALERSHNPGRVKWEKAAREKEQQHVQQIPAEMNEATSTPMGDTIGKGKKKRVREPEQVGATPSKHLIPKSWTSPSDQKGQHMGQPVSKEFRRAFKRVIEEHPPPLLKQYRGEQPMDGSTFKFKSMKQFPHALEAGKYATKDGDKQKYKFLKYLHGARE
jgi:hypothetical protein